MESWEILQWIIHRESWTKRFCGQSLSTAGIGGFILRFSSDATIDEYYLIVINA